MGGLPDRTQNGHSGYRCLFSATHSRTKFDGLIFVILDNAKIHHHLAEELTDRWFFKHHMLLLYLPACSPAVKQNRNGMEAGKISLASFCYVDQKTMEQELDTLLAGYGEKYEIYFS